MLEMQSLKNHFLIAMPNLEGPYFERSVVYLCDHNEEGAMGLVVNLAINLKLGELLDQLEIVPDPAHQKSLAKPVMQGGPVAVDRGFVIHSPIEGFSSSLKMSDDIMVTTSKDILQTLGTDNEPKQFLMALGYAGWEAGQLEQEIINNGWLIVPANSKIIFDTPIHRRWEEAANTLGIDVWQLSSQAGHA